MVLSPVTPSMAPDAGVAETQHARWEPSRQPQLCRERPRFLSKGENGCLVGGIPTPLNNMKVNWDDDIPHIYIYVYIYIYMWEIKNV